MSYLKCVVLTFIVPHTCMFKWIDCTKATLKKLQIAYNNSLPRFMFLPWCNSATEMFVNLGIYFFDEMPGMFVFSFRSRVTASHSQLICSLCSAHYSVYSKLWAWWNSLLHVLYMCSQCQYLSYAPVLCKLIFYSCCIYFIYLHCNELCFVHCLNMDLKSAINVYTKI